MKSCKSCKSCKINETSKWYSGPLCRQCYRKQPHIRQSELTSAKISCKKWREANKDYCQSSHKEWYLLNYTQQIAYQKQYRLNNRDNKRAWEKQDRLTNINRRIADNLRNRINMAIDNGQKVGSAVRDLGCSIEEFKKHLESKFHFNPETGEAMTWDNNTTKGWHIDHIKPLSSFDLTDRTQFLEAASYKNQQPLWWRDNLSKGANYGKI